MPPPLRSFTGSLPIRRFDFSKRSPLALTLRSLDDDPVPDDEVLLHPLEEDWRVWRERFFPSTVQAGFAGRHERFWQWAWAVEAEDVQAEPPRPYVAAWPRGGGKSTTLETAAVAWGARRRRRFVLVVRETQKQANETVRNISAKLDGEAFGAAYPAMARRAMNRFGHSKGYTQQQLRTASGFKVAGLGLDAAGRGIKFDDDRPDAILFDDLDARHDSPASTRKKIETITETVLPMGTPGCVVVYGQNVMIARGVMAQLVGDKADFLVRRIVDGPEAAIEGLRTKTSFDEALGRMRTRVTGGRPTWAGQPLAACQAYIDRYGLRAFLREMQHLVFETEGALWTQARIDGSRVVKTPEMKRVVIGVDPSGGASEIGIVAGGLCYDDQAYVLRDASGPGKPRQWARRVVLLYGLLGADCVVAERNFGGEMVASTIEAVEASVPVKLVTASRGKAIRAEPVAALYGADDRRSASGLVVPGASVVGVPGEGSQVHHVGHFPELESEMTTWVAGASWSPNRLDALVWMLTDLMLGGRGRRQEVTAAVF